MSPTYSRRLVPPSGAGSAQAVVDALEHDGDTVVVDKLGTAASADCTVDSVRSGQAMNQLVQFGPEHLNQLVDQTVYLTAKC